MYFELNTSNPFKRTSDTIKIARKRMDTDNVEQDASRSP